MNRSRFAALAAAGLVAPAAANAAAPLARVRFGTVPVESYALAYYAQDRGFFARSGVDLALTGFAGGGAITAGVAGGALDVGCANVGSLANAHARGLPIRVIAAGGLYTSASPTTVVAVAKTSPLTSAKELGGTTVGVSTLKDLQQASVLKWVDAAGGDGRSVKFVELAITQMPAALSAGRIDAGIVLEPTLTAAKEEIRILGPCYDAVGTSFLISAHFATDDWLAKNAAAAHGVIAALRAGASWANANEAASGRILARVAQIDPARVARMHRVRYADHLAPEMFQPVIDTLAHYGYLPRAFPAAEMFWNGAA